MGSFMRNKEQGRVSGAGRQLLRFFSNNVPTCIAPGSYCPPQLAYRVSAGGVPWSFGGSLPIFRIAAEGVSFFSALLASFDACLSRCTGQEDILTEEDVACTARQLHALLAEIHSRRTAQLPRPARLSCAGERPAQGLGHIAPLRCRVWDLVERGLEGAQQLLSLKGFA
jgi:hypothetical protein